MRASRLRGSGFDVVYWIVHVVTFPFFGSVSQSSPIGSAIVTSKPISTRLGRLRDSRRRRVVDHDDFFWQAILVEIAPIRFARPQPLLRILLRNGLHQWHDGALIFFLVQPSLINLLYVRQCRNLHAGCGEVA